MNGSWSLFAMVSLLMVSRTLATQQTGGGVLGTRGSSGIQIGNSDRRAQQGKESVYGRGGGVRLGEGRFPNSTRQRPYTTTTTTTTTTPLPERITHASNAPAGSSNNITYLEGDSLVRGLISSNHRSSLPRRQGQIQPVSSALQSMQMLEVGMVVPHKSFGVREYTKAVTFAVNTLHKTTKRGRKLKLFERYDIHVKVAMQELTPSPTAILNSLCTEFLPMNVSAILYLMNYEQYGRSTASAQYFLQLAGYLGIPVIAWNADNSGLERRASQNNLQLQLAPSLEHQTAAMLSILERYKWHQFSLVTSQIAGHDDFVQAVRERISDMQDTFKFTILSSTLVTDAADLAELSKSESRVMLLYATREEAYRILQAAKDHKMTGENYVWVVTQSVIENRQMPPSQFPVGMLGVHFDTSTKSLVNEITTAVKVYAYGVEDFVNNQNLSLNTQIGCEGSYGESRWSTGELFFKYLKNVSVEHDQGNPNVEFTQDGVLKAAQLKILNLRPGANKQLAWEEIGVWNSWDKEGLDIKDIVWPGNTHTPPQGVPEKFNLKITFLEESPYINLAPPDPVTGKCLVDRGVHCQIAKASDIADIDISTAQKNESLFQCCSGFCIDLLQKLSEEIGFTYELIRVEDAKWGTLEKENGKWNGLIAELVNRKTDMVMTSLMINSEREAVVDFTVPYMETGIAIVVGKRTGIISPTAFLEPFDTASWMLVGIVAIHAATIMILFFEWLSPSGFNMKNPSPNHRFSFCRTYWLVWAVLFQAAVHIDSPRAFTARFMTNVWALFAVVFLAIYTANLAAFMITREEFHEFQGLDDPRLAKPWSHKPMYKFGTMPWSHTESTLSKYFKEMHAYMKAFNKSNVAEGIEAVISGELDAFIYDGTVLDYLVGQDEDCRLLTVGSWYAMTGYGLAFPRNSKYLQMFNKRLLDYRDNGDLERLRRYWLTGTCKPGKEVQKSSDPLALEQFLSAFLLLMMGILLAAAFLLLEHLYFKYVRQHLARSDGGGCCTLFSLSMGKSLTFRGAVFEAQDILRYHRCRDPICDTHLWKVKHELDMARIRIRQLEKDLEAHGIKPRQTKRKTGSLGWWRRCFQSSDRQTQPEPLSVEAPHPLPPYFDSFIDAIDVARPRDMTRNHVVSTEYADKFLPPEIYRIPDDGGAARTEIAEMETVL
ncbi:glutamate ionotropic receptor NMDA type subunit 2 isoform X4 [Lasioglossum baleicum]|uniref:glutamate ionotropic receptor NMDA type subunit 2 isoform X4 n=1 Tax=Lasioglossum baleicum TaxID=434251 RepID=UPI003FCED1EE